MTEPIPEDIGRFIDAHADQLASDLVDLLQRSGIDLDKVIAALEKEGFKPSMTNEIQFEREDMNQEEFNERADSFVNVTENFKRALTEAGEPGIADAITGVMVNPNPEGAAGSTAVGMMTKRWFSFEGLSDHETKMVYRGIMLAARAEGIEWKA